MAEVTDELIDQAIRETREFGEVSLLETTMPRSRAAVRQFRRLRYEAVKAHRPCALQLALFKRYCGKKGYVAITEVWAKRHAAEFDWGWAAAHLLSLSALAAHEKAEASARAVHKEAKASAFAAYWKATAPARAVYKKATATARAAYKEAEYAAWETYVEATATAWARAYISMGDNDGNA